MTVQEQRWALVTGGAGALGRAIVDTLIADGYSVAVHYFEGAEAARSLVRQYDSRAFCLQADVSSWDAVARMEGEFRERANVSAVTALVNAAGIRADGLMAGQSTQEWRRVVEVNLLGTFHVCRAFLPRMLQNRCGRILNIVSPAALKGSPGQTAYSASKAGVVGLTRTLAVECGRRGVTVNALSPGFMDTPLTAGVPADVRELLVQGIPLRRVTTPEEIARLVPQLLAHEYITGQVISADGGLSAW